MVDIGRSLVSAACGKQPLRQPAGVYRPKLASSCLVGSSANNESFYCARPAVSTDESSVSQTIGLFHVHCMPQNEPSEVHNAGHGGICCGVHVDHQWQA